MPDRTSYKPGTISWTDLATTDQDGAKAFYGGLLGWEYDDQPAGEGVIYSMAKLRGRAAAAITLPIVIAGRCGGKTTGKLQSSSYWVSVV